MSASSFTRLTLPARIESGEAFREFVREGAREAGLSSDQMSWLDLILEEILVNIARNAYPPTESGDTEVAYARLEQGTLLVEISDHGRSFNPLELPPPAMGDDLATRQIGGLGVFLVKSAADSLAYRREDGRNTLSFRFPRPA
jgi:anti-sigma regulatory factor (Ser/Thr protein kinase)